MALWIRATECSILEIKLFRIIFNYNIFCFFSFPIFFSLPKIIEKEERINCFTHIYLHIYILFIYLTFFCWHLSRVYNCWSSTFWMVCNFLFPSHREPLFDSESKIGNFVYVRIFVDSFLFQNQVRLLLLQKKEKKGIENNIVRHSKCYYYTGSAYT